MRAALEWMQKRLNRCAWMGSDGWHEWRDYDTEIVTPLLAALASSEGALCELYFHRPADKRPNLPADQLRKLDDGVKCTCPPAPTFEEPLREARPQDVLDEHFVNDVKLLDEYTEHEEECGIEAYTTPCNCGLQEIQNRVRAAIKLWHEKGGKVPNAAAPPPTASSGYATAALRSLTEKERAFMGRTYRRIHDAAAPPPAASFRTRGTEPVLVGKMRQFAEECLRRHEINPEYANEIMHTADTYKDILKLCALLSEADSQRCQHGVWAADHCFQCEAQAGKVAGAEKLAGEQK